MLLSDFHEYVVSRIKSPNNPKRHVEKILYLAASILSLYLMHISINYALNLLHERSKYTSEYYFRKQGLTKMSYYDFIEMSAILLNDLLRYY